MSYRIEFYGKLSELMKVFEQFLVKQGTFRIASELKKNILKLCGLYHSLQFAGWI